MDKKELYQLVEASVSDLFYQYQKANGIENGDIDPMEAFELDELQEKLTDLIIRANQNK
jgi:hypothetical protein